LTAEAPPGPALVLGANGQDGSYLAEVLIERGWRVVGAARQPASRWVAHPAYRHVALDIGDAAALSALLQTERPSRVFALAAIHGSSGHAYEAEWRSALDVNVGSVHTCLEYMRVTDPDCRLFLASSLKAFGENPPAVIDESSPRVSSCLYAMTKNAATDLIYYYRLRHGLWAFIGWLFNHDSPRRPADYFLPRLAAQLAAHLAKAPAPPPLASVDFWCDWGSSLDYMRAVAELAELDTPHDVVMATGSPVYAGELARALGDLVGVSATAWLRTLSNARPKTRGAPAFRADTARLRSLVGEPQRQALDVVLWILRERHGLAVERADLSLSGRSGS